MSAPHKTGNSFDLLKKQTDEVLQHSQATLPLHQELNAQMAVIFENFTELSHKLVGVAEKHEKPKELPDVKKIMQLLKETPKAAQSE